MKHWMIMAATVVGLGVGCCKSECGDDGYFFRPAGMSDGITVVDTAGCTPMKWSPLYPSGKLELAEAVTPKKKSVVNLLEFQSHAKGSSVSLVTDDPVDVYGGGEYEGPLRLNGQTIILANFDNWIYEKKTHGLYQSYPWAFGVRKDGTAFGILVDCTYEGKLAVDKKGGIHFDFTSPTPPRVIVIEKDNPMNVVKALSEVIGTIDMPPMWALGYQQSRWSYETPKRALEVAKGLREHRMPADVIWFDIDYMDGFRIFTFNPKTFPNPKKVNDDLHALNFKTVWMIDPGVKDDPNNNYEVYDSGTKEDVWIKYKGTDTPYIASVWPGNCVFPDYTCPKVREWWRGLYKDYMATGMDGVWNDMNEPAWHHPPKGTKLNMDLENQKAWFRGGDDMVPGPYTQYRNLYGFLMVRSSREGIMRVRPNERPFILSRANFIGGHRYAAVWTGDNASTDAHMKVSIPMSIALGLCGQPLSGPDIGGFGGSAKPKLMGEWYSLAPFYPFSRNHSVKGSKAQEPWAFGDEVTHSARISLERRYRLMPYLYTLTAEAARTGMPIMRPMLFLDPKNPVYRNEDALFMFGNDLAVAPIWGDKSKLPAWPVVSITEGDLKDKYQAEIRIRPGSVVPLCRNIPQHTGEVDFGDLELLICPDADGNAEGTLYEDDTKSLAYKDGKHRITKFKFKVTNGKVLTPTSQGMGAYKSKIPAFADIKFTIVK